ncbi:uncharacterized protein LOC126841072 [Adelges cooleyi]|uniref:uncharacterized protein LOC126841072 n=1 Tax=Adelges cooleyi TaxID=133065 RepID=UPI00217F8250|nr:uncharacterized protein LOC126841072 [Adelges cooleyi]
MYPNVVCTRPCHRINVMRSTTCYDSEYDTDKSYTSSKFSEPYRDIRCQSSQTDLILIDRPYPSLLSWQRSSSCKEFNSSPRSGSGGTPPVDNEEVMNYSFDKNSPLDHHRITKIFSSSYPGTTSSLSTESGSDRKLEKAGSVRRAVDPADDLYQDDVSQDSYELLEKEEVFDVNASDDDKDDNDNDEIFYADIDFKEEHMQEIEKRLGYLEPKYRDMEFNKFNEICKKEMASRSKEQIFIDSPMRFIAFENKTDTVVTGHVPVERTKSDSYMSAPKPKPHRLLHQKSIDLTPMDSYEPTAAAKFDLDIPYTLHKRQTPDTLSPNEVKWSTVVCGSDHYSQDSGLSLSTQSTSNVSVENDSPIDLNKLLLNKHHDDVVTTSKSTELIQMAYKSSSFNESDVCAARRAAAADKPHKLKSCHSADSVPTNRSKRIYYQPLSADNARHRKKVDVIKIEPTAVVGGSANSKELIIIEYSSDGKSKKLKKDGSGGSAENKSFASSSGVSPEKQVAAKPVTANVFKSSAVKVKIASALALNSGVGCVHVVPNAMNEPTIMDVDALTDIVSKSVQSFPEPTCSVPVEGVAEPGTGVKDEEQVVPDGRAKSVDKSPGSNLKTALLDLVSTDRTSETRQEPAPESSNKDAKINRFKSLASKIAAFDAFTDNIKIADKSTAELPRKKLPEKMQLSNKRVKSPVLFARLGLSESSAFPNSSGQGHSQRRAVSLDSPVVSLHQLPLVTSFSSKDDTVDDPEDGVGPEEKPIRWWDDHVNETVVRCMADMVEITVADMSEEKRDSVTSLSPNMTPERRRSSTRQERLDSFKKLKNFEMEVWESNDLNAAVAIDFEHKDFEDETFAEPQVEVEVAESSRQSDGKTDIKGFTDDESASVDESADSSAEIPFKELNSVSSDEAKRSAQNNEQNTVSEHVEEQHSPIKPVEEPPYDVPCSSPEALAKPSVDKPAEERRDSAARLPPPEALAENINHAELINKLGCIEIPSKQDSKRNRLSVESSGSSSLDDPPHMDDTSGNMADDEDVTSSPLPPTPDASYTGMYLIGYGIYGLSRTLSRISEQSTSERSEVDDELSTKHSTQSASFDDSILSSDYCQPSLCSDAMDSLPDLPPLPEEYAFEIPPPAVDDVDWPSPKSEERTPVGPQLGRFEDDEDDDAKTIHNEDDDDREGAMTGEEGEEEEEEEEVAPRRPHSTNKPRLSLGDDTSAGVSTSEFSSNATIVYHYDNVCPPPEFLSKAEHSDEYDSPFTDDSDESKSYHRPSGHLFELPRSTGVPARPKGRLSHGPSSLDANTGTPKTKNTARARCHSYYSLPRSPPSDGSSSSTQDSPNVPNTIPRASRRRRYTHTLKRKAKIIQITKV